MPKSKEFIDNSDSGSDEESGATATSKKPVAKGLNDKNDVSNFKEKNLWFSSLIDFSFALAVS